MAKENKLETVNAEIAALEQHQQGIQQQVQALEIEVAQAPTLDTEKYQLFPSLEAAMKAVGLRLGLLQDNKAQLEREQLFVEFERQTKAQHAYYVQIAAIDTQVHDLQQQIETLTRQKKAMESENRVPANRRIELFRQLSSGCTAEERERLNKIYKRNQVNGYF